MPFLMYRDNDSGLRPSSYPYILGRALNEYRINTSVTIYLLFPYHDLYILSMKLSMWFHNLSLYLLFNHSIYGHLFSLISHCAGAREFKVTTAPFSPGMILDNHCKCWIREYINIKKMRFKWTLDHGNPTFAVRIIILYVETGVYCVQVCLCWGRDAARGDPGRGERWLAPEVTWPRSARPSVRSGSTDSD